MIEKLHYEIKILDQHFFLANSLDDCFMQSVNLGNLASDSLV